MISKMIKKKVFIFIEIPPMIKLCMDSTKAISKSSTGRTKLIRNIISNEDGNLCYKPSEKESN